MRWDLDVWGGIMLLGRWAGEYRERPIQIRKHISDALKAKRAELGVEKNKDAVLS